MGNISVNELYRPQFHFTAQKNWLNDPNGLVYYEGEYHLFFQHNPAGLSWGNMTWGHAISTDLVHWRQLPNALEVDAMGMMFSGSAVVDWKNTAGFQCGAEKSLVAIYTAAGGSIVPKVPDTQCLAFSNDRGRTWTKFKGNPVVPQITAGNRDPKVFWHEPTEQWVMALYVAGEKEELGLHFIEFLGSRDLKSWTRRGRIEGFYECPDLFELAVDGLHRETRWVLFGADGRYRIGHFDGREFLPEGRKITGDWGDNFYAAQTYSDIPASDGRRILIAWMMGGSYPGMAFNQQMTFPCELSLRSLPDGIRLCKLPVREITGLRARTHQLVDLQVASGQNPLSEIAGELFDIEADIEVGTAAEFGFNLRGHNVSYLVGDRILCSGKRCALLPPMPGTERVRIRIVLDRASVEVFGNDGRVAMSSCILPSRENRGISFYSIGGASRLVSVSVHELKSARS